MSPDPFDPERPGDGLTDSDSAVPSESDPAADEPGDLENIQPVALPRWVPVLIGTVLVVMAGLAVYTGTTTKIRNVGGDMFRRALGDESPQRARQPEAGVPGEPEPGGSKLIHHEAGGPAPLIGPGGEDSDPAAPPPAEFSRAKIRRQFLARRGVVFEVEPVDALVSVNGRPIGTAHQFSTAGEVYELPSEGVFLIRLDAPEYGTAEYLVVADESASNELATITVKLDREGVPPL